MLRIAIASSELDEAEAALRPQARSAMLYRQHQRRSTLSERDEDELVARPVGRVHERDLLALLQRDGLRAAGERAACDADLHLGPAERERARRPCRRPGTRRSAFTVSSTPLIESTAEVGLRLPERASGCATGRSARRRGRRRRAGSGSAGVLTVGAAERAVALPARRRERRARAAGLRRVGLGCSRPAARTDPCRRTARTRSAAPRPAAALSARVDELGGTATGAVPSVGGSRASPSRGAGRGGRGRRATCGPFIIFSVFGTENAITASRTTKPAIAIFFCRACLAAADVSTSGAPSGDRAPAGARRGRRVGRRRFRRGARRPRQAAQHGGGGGRRRSRRSPEP